LQTKTGKRFLRQEDFLQVPCKTGSWCALRESLQITEKTLQPFLHMDSEHRGKRNQNTFWHFNIFGTVVITFFRVLLKRINSHNIREKTGSSHNRLQGQG
jgi:hypothetical protein